MKDLLYVVLGLLSAGGGAYFMYKYISQKPGETSYTFFILAIVLIILALAFGAMFLLGKVNKTEEIHITE